MRRVLVDRPAGPPYRTRVCRGLPYALIKDADGFPEVGLNDNLTFVAWQDHPPRHCHQAAHDLAQAATWLGCHHLTWAQSDRSVWAGHCQDLAGERPDRAAWLSVYRATATLHRVYAFWHWRQWLHGQPFPGSRDERHEWLHTILPPTHIGFYPKPRQLCQPSASASGTKVAATLVNPMTIVLAPTIEGLWPTSAAAARAIIRTCCREFVASLASHRSVSSRPSSRAAQYTIGRVPHPRIRPSGRGGVRFIGFI